MFFFLFPSSVSLFLFRLHFSAVLPLARSQAGQDRFRSVTRSYYRGAVACMVVFSLTDRASYDKLPQWLADARAQARPDIALILVGNKADLAGDRQVDVLEASRLAQREGCCAYVETSARSGEGVEPAFFKLARTVLARAAE